jgi:Htaa protein
MPGVAAGDRTWLGFVTSPNPALGNGTVTAGDAASGPTVTPVSPRGRDVLDTFSFPVQTGTSDAASGRGAIQQRGTVTFDMTGSQGGNFKITVTDPLVVLNGAQPLALAPVVDPPAPQPPAIQPPPAHGQLFATGTNVGGQAYDTAQPILNLDLGGRP